MCLFNQAAMALNMACPTSLVDFVAMEKESMLAMPVAELEQWAQATRDLVSNFFEDKELVHGLLVCMCFD